MGQFRWRANPENGLQEGEQHSLFIRKAAAPGTAKPLGRIDLRHAKVEPRKFTIGKEWETWWRGTRYATCTRDNSGSNYGIVITDTRQNETFYIVFDARN